MEYHLGAGAQRRAEAGGVQQVAPELRFWFFPGFPFILFAENRTEVFAVCPVFSIVIYSLLI